MCVEMCQMCPKGSSRVPVGCPSGTGLTLLLIWPLLTGSGGERRLSLLPRAPPPACGISPRFSLRSVEPLLTGSRGERRLSLLPRAPHQLAGFHRTSPCVQSSLSLPDPGGAPAVAPPPGPPPACVISPHFSLRSAECFRAPAV